MLNAIEGPLTAVHDTQKMALGVMYQNGGKVYLYVKGVASCVAGDWVTFDENYAITRLVADAVGRVGIMLAAVVANKYGWCQVFGVNTVARTDTVAADAALYIDGSTGRADDAAVTGDLILGAKSETADTSNVATVSLNFPYVTNILG